jgi:hypothetical protein
MNKNLCKQSFRFLAYATFLILGACSDSEVIKEDGGYQKILIDPLNSTLSPLLDNYPYSLHLTEDGGVLFSDGQQLVKYDRNGNNEWGKGYEYGVSNSVSLRFSSLDETADSYNQLLFYHHFSYGGFLQTEDSIVKVRLDKKTGREKQRIKAAKRIQKGENVLFMDKLLAEDTYLLVVSKPDKKLDFYYLDQNLEIKRSQTLTFGTEMNSMYSKGEKLFVSSFGNDFVLDRALKTVRKMPVSMGEFIEIQNDEFWGYRFRSLYDDGKLLFFKPNETLIAIDQINYDSYSLPIEESLVSTLYDQNLGSKVFFLRYQNRIFVLYTTMRQDIKLLEYIPQKKTVIVRKNMQNANPYELVDVKISPFNGDLFIAAQTMIDMKRKALSLIKIPYSDLGE